MTKWLLDHNDQFRRWEEIVVVFANTGQENEETLEFVKECDDHFGFNTVWIEAVQFLGERRSASFRIVDFKTADRAGRTFEDSIKKYGIPNQKFKDCTRNLKQKPIEAYAKSIGWRKGSYELAIGIRADEIDRCSTAARERGIIYPLAKIHPMTKPKINFWWEQQPFRLRLKHWQGNCKWCWKKSKRKHFTILRHQPEAFDFPERMEEEFGLIGPEFLHDKSTRHSPLPEDYRRTFFRGNVSAKDLKKEFRERGHLIADAEDQAQEFDPELDVGGACGDSCEVFSDEDWRPVQQSKKSSGKSQRPSQRGALSGKRLWPTCDSNPRKKGGWGWHSYNILLEKPGLTYEEYRESGGRLNDLKWDIDRARVRID
jgi:hypothetical protein